jgi:hypothetical protein
MAEARNHLRQATAAFIAMLQDDEWGTTFHILC